jgi:UDP-N-acetylglucosamine 2-epimerase
VHIEAGLRSFNRTMPEEINRIVTDHVSTYLFAPTQTAVNNLNNEGLGNYTYLTGDIMVDTMKSSIAVASEKSIILNDLQLKGERFSLLTLHRHYNVDDSGIMQNILSQLGDLQEKIVFPVHPRTKKMLPIGYTVPSNIVLTEPKGYIDFIALEQAAERIITDSGGIQKEAYLLQKPCITLRTETEWVETVSAGWNLLINPSEKNIAAQISSFIVPEIQENIFGNAVAENMVDIINTIKP